MFISSMWYKEGIFRERWLLKSVFNHEIMYKKFSFAYIDYLSSSKDNKYNQPISAKRKLNQYVGPWKYIHAWKNEPLILIYYDWTIIYSHIVFYEPYVKYPATYSLHQIWKCLIFTLRITISSSKIYHRSSWW